MKIIFLVCSSYGGPASHNMYYSTIRYSYNNINHRSGVEVGLWNYIKGCLKSVIAYNIDVVGKRARVASACQGMSSRVYNNVISTPETIVLCYDLKLNLILFEITASQSEAS